MIRNIKITIDRDKELDVCTVTGWLEYGAHPAHSLYRSPLMTTLIGYVTKRECVQETADLTIGIRKALTSQHIDFTVNGVTYAFNLSVETESGEWLPWIIDATKWGKLTLRNYIDQSVYWLDRGGYVKVLLEPNEMMVDKIIDEVFHRCRASSTERARNILLNHITAIDSLCITECLICDGYGWKVCAPQDYTETCKELRRVIVG